MSDLISREVAIKELRKYADIKCNNGYIDTANGILTAMTWIKNMVSAVDAVEVVRCQECRYWKAPVDRSIGVCLNTNWLPLDCMTRPKTAKEHFCRYGEQRMKRYIHGYFGYVCDSCGSRHMIGIEKGLEECCNTELKQPSGLPHKPTPFIIKCPDCATGFMSHRTTYWLSDFEEARKGSDIFMNTRNCECGKIRFKWGGE